MKTVVRVTSFCVLIYMGQIVYGEDTNGAVTTVVNTTVEDTTVADTAGAGKNVTVTNVIVTKNDENNYQGDVVSFPVEVMAYTLDTDGVTSTPSYCVAAKTELRVLGPKTATVNSKSVPGKLYVLGEYVFTNVQLCATSANKTPPPPGVALWISDSDFTDYSAERYGLTYGGLIVPFKYHFSGSKDFKGNSTIAPYLGYRFDKNSYGFGIKLVGFAGMSAIDNTTKDENGNSKSESLAGFSYGVGILGSIKHDFQWGIVIGADRVSHGSDYEDDGKAWGALALGYAFEK